jgi:hypothetical protein
MQAEEQQQPQPVQLEAPHFSGGEDSSLREILNAAESEVILRARAYRMEPQARGAVAEDQLPRAAVQDPQPQPDQTGGGRIERVSRSRMSYYTETLTFSSP